MANSRPGAVWWNSLVLAIVLFCLQEAHGQAGQGYGYLYGGFQPQLSMGVDRGGDVAIFGGPTANLGAMLFGGGGGMYGAGMLGTSPYAYLHGGGQYGGYPMWGANVSPWSNPWTNPGWPYGYYCYGMPWIPGSYGPGQNPYYWQQQMNMQGCAMMTCGSYSRRESSSGGSYGPPTSQPTPPSPSPSSSPKVETPAEAVAQPPPPPPETPKPIVVTDPPKVDPPKEEPKVPAPPKPAKGEENTTEVHTDKTCLETRNAYLEARGLGLLKRHHERQPEGRFCVNCSMNPDIEIKGDAKAILARVQSLAEDPVARSAQELMAAYYGNCDVLHSDNMACPEDVLKGIDPEVQTNKDVKRKIEDKDALINSHPYLSQICRSSELPKECRGVCETLPIFDFGGILPFTPSDKDGGKISVKPKPGINLVQGANNMGAGIDCSAFVSAALRKSGLRVLPKNMRVENDYRMTTRFFLQDNPSECIKPVEFSKDETLKAGDILTFTGHMLIVESAGKDPFGFDHWGNDCSVPKDYRKHLDFNIIQSTGYRGGLGVSRMRAKDYLFNLNGSLGGFDLILKRTCLAQKNKSAEKIKATHKGWVTVDKKDPKTGKFTVAREFKNILSITRHVGESNPNCTIGKVEIADQNKCSKECLEAANKKTRGAKK